MHTALASRNSQSRDKRQNSQDAHSLSSEAPTEDEAVDYDVQEDEDLQEISDTNEVTETSSKLELPQFNSPAARRSASPQEISRNHINTKRDSQPDDASIRQRFPSPSPRPPIQLGHARQPLIMASETMMSSKSSIILGTRIPHLLNNQASPRRANEQRLVVQRLVDSHFQLIPLIDESQQKPQWSAGPSTSDTHASPKPRHRKHSIDQALESAGSDLNDVDVNTERDAPTVSNSGWPTEAHFTPKAPGQRSLNLKAQPLALQSVLRTAIRKSNTHGLFENAYPSTDGGFKHFRTILRTLARSLGYEKLADRFTRDTQFGIIIARPSLRRKQKPPLSGYYNILAGENVEATVKALLKDSKLLQLVLCARNPSTITALWLFFMPPSSKDRGTLADKHGNHFKSSMTEGPKASELRDPAAMACLSATAVHWALDEWVNTQSKSLDFDSGVYAGIYQRHTPFLSQIKTNNLRAIIAHG
ncbi:hypothetical protein HGRIS_005270 [Hohenbuehelia grisea]|uniref:DUF6532 domain-containing protein n=1 Tax=Hohenbuehelia grisea TaxID=104357 RepID=A0ABR3JFH4_9AGAR